MRTYCSVFVIASLSVAAPVAAQVAPTLNPGETLLEVASTGEAFAVPDRAVINAGVTTLAPTAAEAATANAQKMQQLVAALRSAGVAAADTRTSMVNLSPNQTWTREDGPRITGYTATNNLTIMLRDPAKAAAIIAAAFGGGANNVNGPNFSLSNSSAALTAARADAVKRAREQANAYAANFGMKVVRVIRISERGQQAMYQPIVVTGSLAGLPPPPPPPAPVPPGAGTPVETGHVEQDVNLWVDFALAPK